MRTIRPVVLLGLVGLLAASCGALPDTITINVVGNTPDVSGLVQATFQALTEQAGPTGVPTSTPAPTMATAGSISGSLNYPADTLPALYVVAYQAGTQNYKYAQTVAGQGTYEIEGLIPGTYTVVAYTIGGGGFPQGLAGGYTQAVPCGLAANCTDHSPIPVVVSAGQVASGVNPTDWFAPTGAFPAFPQQAALPATTPSLPPAIADGSISGNLMYPASGIPSLRIVAFQVGGSAYHYVDTGLGQSSYTIEHLPPGTYHVVAYTLAGGGFTPGLAGGYSQMVPCGLKYGCSDHTLIDVVVTSGSTTSGIDPNDYYADPGTFPPNPLP